MINCYFSQLTFVCLEQVSDVHGVAGWPRHIRLSPIVAGVGQSVEWVVLSGGDRADVVMMVGCPSRFDHFFTAFLLILLDLFAL